MIDSFRLIYINTDCTDCIVHHAGMMMPAVFGYCFFLSEYE